MPKVNEEYSQKKKDEILDAAYRVAMSKPVYEVSMRDVILESGRSQGWIYRYYSSLDEILMALINRECVISDMAAQTQLILERNQSPEQTLYDLFGLWKDNVLKHLIGVGKIYFELSTMYANSQEKLEQFQTNIRMCREEAAFQQLTFEWIARQAKAGTFTPQLPLEDIIIFLATALDGVIRDLILCHHYPVSNVFSGLKAFNADRIIYSTCTALLLLLGGDTKKITKGVFADENH